MLLDDSGLENELARMTDWFTDRMAFDSFAKAGVAGTVFANSASRLLIDPERFVGDEEPMRAVGMGPVYLATADKAELRVPDPERDDRLMNRWFHPYAAAFEGLINETLLAHGRAVIVDLHSFPKQALPYELDQMAERPGICIGTDSFHTPQWLKSVARKAFTSPSWEVRANPLFAGTYVPLSHFRRTPDVHSVMIEVRRDQYQAEPGGRTHGGYEVIVDHLSALFRALA